MSTSEPTTAVTTKDIAETKRWAREVCFNVLLSLLFLQFAIQHIQSAVDVLRLSTILLLAKVSTDVFFYLIRRVPKGVSMSLYDWFIAIAGTYAIVLFAPVEHGSDRVLGQVLQIAGMSLQVLAMLSLNRSIGIVAANRGVKTNGLYRFVRHPLYASYVVAFGGYVLNQPSLYNLSIYGMALMLWVLRLMAEERFLLQDESYRDYAAQVRWRIMPGVF